MPLVDGDLSVLVGVYFLEQLKVTTLGSNEAGFVHAVRVAIQETDFGKHL